MSAAVRPAAAQLHPSWKEVLMPLSKSEAVHRFGEESIHVLSDDEFIVAGEYFEPLRQQQCVLVEQAPAARLAAADATGWLTSWARVNFPDAQLIIVRNEELTFHLHGFDDYSYYMVLEGDPVSAEQTGDIAVRPADPVQDRDKVSFWLVQAFEDALEMRSEKGPEGAAEAQSDAVLDDRQSRSFLAAHGGVDIGHVTLLDDQLDDLTGIEYTELLDVLVERKHPRRHAAEAALVQHAWQCAKDAGKPLLGHIVVRDKTCHCAGVEQTILDRLRTRGWKYSHKFQIAELAA
jgi:hypothetical protein